MYTPPNTITTLAALALGWIGTPALPAFGDDRHRAADKQAAAAAAEAAGPGSPAWSSGSVEASQSHRGSR